MRSSVLAAVAMFAMATEAKHKVYRQEVSTSPPRPTERALLRNKVKRDCPMDACLSVIEASSQCGCIRMGSADCVRYLHTTITPDRETETVTVSIYTTPGITDTTIITDTETTTTTATNEATARVTTSTTSTRAPPNPPTRKRFAKRDPEDRHMPYYAESACVSAAAYTSACGCVGVSTSTSYAPTPTPRTVTVSGTYTGDTTTSTTSIVTTVQATLTTTRTTTVATSTTTSVVDAYGPFHLMVLTESNNAPHNWVSGFLQNTFVSGAPLDGQLATLNFTAFPANVAGQYWIDEDGYLRPSSADVVNIDNVFVVYQPDLSAIDPRQLELRVSETNGQGGYLRIQVMVDLDNVISLVGFITFANTFLDCQNGKAFVGVPSVNNFNYANCNSVSLQVHPLGYGYDLCRRDTQGRRAC